MRAPFLLSLLLLLGVAVTHQPVEAALEDDVVTKSYRHLQQQETGDETTTLPTLRQFCSDLSSLENHLDSEWAANIGNFTLSFRCYCNQDTTHLAVQCSLVYALNGVTFQNTETATFELNEDNDRFALVQTGWTDTYYGSGLRHFFDINPDGTMASCSATGCASCTVCSDGSSVAVDCSTLSPDLQWMTDCAEEYPGSFLNSYEFGEILVDAPQTVDEFCSNLTDLETYLTLELESFFELDIPEKYACVCKTPNEGTLVVDCSITYSATIEGASYVNAEQGIWELGTNGIYVLTTTSWSDSFYGSGLTHSFDLDSDGTLLGCTAVGCASCSICEDGKTVAVDCSTLSPELQWTSTCVGDYKGSYMNNYVRVEITGPVPDIPAVDSDSSQPVPGDLPVVADSPQPAPTNAPKPTTALEPTASTPASFPNNNRPPVSEPTVAPEMTGTSNVPSSSKVAGLILSVAAFTVSTIALLL